MSRRFLAILFASFLMASLLVGCFGQEPVSEDSLVPPSSSSPAPESSSSPPPESSSSPPPESSSSPPPSLPPPPQTPAPTQLTMLSITEGEVFIMKAGADDWVEAEVGMSLEPSDTIKTGNYSSRALITFFEGTTIELKAGTQIEVSSLDFAVDTGSTTILLKQQIGETISRVKKLADPASRYEVETPAGVMAVRGSIVHVNVEGNGVTTVVNQQGSMSFIAQGVSTFVPEGMQCRTRPGKPPGKLFPWTEEEEEGSEDGELYNG